MNLLLQRHPILTAFLSVDTLMAFYGKVAFQKKKNKK